MNKAQTIVLTSVITFIATSALWVAGLSYLYFLYMESPTFSVAIETPEQVKLEDTFEVSVTVTNPSEEDTMLGSIDIYDSLLEGFEIVSIQPRPDDTMHQFGFHTAYFNHKMPPAATFTATYTLKAKQGGLWVGDIDCCTPNEQFVTVSKAISVIE